MLSDAAFDYLAAFFFVFFSLTPASADAAFFGFFSATTASADAAFFSFATSRDFRLAAVFGCMIFFFKDLSRLLKASAIRFLAASVSLAAIASSARAIDDLVAVFLARLLSARRSDPRACFKADLVLFNGSSFDYEPSPAFA